MTDTNPSVNPVPSVDDDYADVLDEILTLLRAGKADDVEACLGKHPQYADQLQQVLPAMTTMVDLGASLPTSDEAEGLPFDTADGHKSLGDFRIVRQVGRGGMGVVYEAEQLSLNRRVALKVLPFAAVLDERQLQRFKNEAKAAATLHHNNIVPVYSVGCDRGVHYYAMQFIEGHSLAEIIDQMRRRDDQSPHSSDATPLGIHITTSLDVDNAGGEASNPAAGNGDADGGTRATVASHETQREVQAAISTQRTVDMPAHFRTLATLGIQAAEALDHAHLHGILHRDIKPANLLMDKSGRLWITDFGLARLEDDAGMTMTGDLVGTIRYMSPEQALANRVVVDHRTDVYSLGATLYELLTLQPAFLGKNRQEVLKRVAFEEPTAPSRVNRAIPVDLETIVLKAMAKEPHERYATAGRMADDLRRFLDHRPIQARRPTAVAKLRKWSHRNRAVLAATVLALTIAACVSSVLLWRANLRTNTAMANVEDKNRELERRGRELDEQRKALTRALNNAIVGKTLIEAEHNDNMFVELSERLVTDAPEREENRHLLIGALMSHGHKLMMLKQLPEAKGRFERAIAECQDLVNDFHVHSDSLCEAYFHHGRVLSRMEDYAGAVKSYSRYLDGDPDCVAVLNNRGDCHISLGQFELARRDIERSIELAPRDYRPHRSMGFIHRGTGDYEKAMECFTKTIEFRPVKSPKYYSYRGEIAFLMGRYDDATADFLTAIELTPEYSTANAGLAMVLATGPDDKTDIERALTLATIAAESDAREDNEDSEQGSVIQGIVLYHMSQYENAIEALQHTFDLDPRDRPLMRTGGYYLATALWKLGKKEEARKIHERTIEWLDHYQISDPHSERIEREVRTLVGLSEGKANIDRQEAADETRANPE